MNYWDTSALVALLVKEQQSESRAALFGRDAAIVTWWGTHVEFVSALMRGHREGRSNTAELQQSFERLRRLSLDWRKVPPDQDTHDQAVRLLRIHPLSAGDAFQLAAALKASKEDSQSLGFVCSDIQLSRAARREGFSVL